MKKKKVLLQVVAFLAVIFTNIVSFVILLQLLSPLNMMLQSGWVEGPGATQFFKALTGGPLIILVAVIWMGFFIYSFNYYFDAPSFKSLLRRFTFFSGWEFLILPLIVLVNHLVFPSPVISLEWIIVGVGLVLGAGSIWVSHSVLEGSG